MSYEDERTAIHEAGHLVVASVLGRVPRSATVNGGAVLAGCARYALPDPVSAQVLDGLDYDEPFITWPADVRRRLEVNAMVAMAGDIAAGLLAPQFGRVADPVAVTVADDVAAVLIAPAAEDDQLWASAVVEDPPFPSDSEQVAQAAFMAFGRDPVQAAAWTAWLGSQVTAVIWAREAAVRRLAAALTAHRVMGPEALAAVIGGHLWAVPA